MPSSDANKASAERVAQIQKAWQIPGASLRSVSAASGCSPATAKKYRPDLVPSATVLSAQKPLVSSTIPPSVLTGFQQAAQERDEFVVPPAELWQREEKRCALAIRKAKAQGNFRWQCPHPHLLLTFISDLHIAPGTAVDFEQMRRDAELIRDTPGCYGVIVGDVVDNHIKHRSAVLGARSQPSDQYELFEYYMSILGPKCIVVTSGNHDNWTDQIAGIDVLSRIVRERRVFYSPDEAYLEIGVGSQVYKVAVRHQYKYQSAFNQTHSVKQWLRMGPVDFDIGVIGHMHEAALEQFIWRDQFRWAARPGSYQILTSFTRQFGFNRSIPTCPTFLLQGDQREITGFKSLASLKAATNVLRTLAA